MERIKFKVKKRAKVREAEEREIKTKLRKMLIFSILLGIVILFFFAQKECKKFLFSFPGLNLEEIEVRGTSPEKIDYLIKKVNLKKGRNIFEINLDEISHQLSQELLIRKVVILRNLPNKIVIKVEERKPFIITKWDKQIFGIDRDGVILPEPYNSFSFIEVKGILKRKPLLGGKIKMKEMKTITEIQNLFSQVLPHFQISSLDLSQKRKIILFSNKNYYYLSAENLANNLSLLPTLLADLSQKGIEYEYIDLRFKDIYVKPIKK